MPRLRRRPRSSLWQTALRHRACRIGFIAGFVAGIVFVAGLSHSDSRGLGTSVASASTTPADARARH